MRHSVVRVYSITLAVLLGCAGAATAQTTSNGPYYATPSWDQKLQCDTKATCPRFVVLANWNGEAVLDRETGLVWQQNPQDFGLTWIEAQQSVANGCISVTTGGRSGWRLPTIEEFQSLSDGTELTTLPAGHPFGANADGLFWTATTSLFTADDGVAWGTTNGGAFSKTLPLKFWCVRGTAHLR